MESIHNASRQYGGVLRNLEQCLYFADVVQYLTTAVPSMCLTFPTPSIDDPDPWQERPFFQLILPSAADPADSPAPESRESRESRSIARAPESRSNWVRRMLSKIQTGPTQEMYTVSYFGEPAHAPTIIPPSGSTGDRVIHKLLRTTRRGLPPEQAAYVELLAHGLYAFVCNHKQTFVTTWQVEKAMASHTFSIKWYLHTLEEALNECGFRSKPSETDTQLPPWDRFDRFGTIESLSSRVFDSRDTRPSRSQLERTLSAISDYRRSFQMVRPHTDVVRSTPITPRATSRPMSWGPTTAPLPGMI